MPKMYSIVVLLLISVLLNSCQETAAITSPMPVDSTTLDSPPEWSKRAIWYEIGVERFRNGDPSNDPTAADISGAYPGFVPEGWAVTPWTQDWYKQDAYFSNLAGHQDFFGNELKKFVDKVQMRRYGGDLQGVLDKVNYLDSLGVTAIYFRPLNDAPSLHKYDARNWRHIDVNFGPNPEKDKAMMAAEVPDDPSTWAKTEADQLFLQVLKTFHEKGIRVILDYSWNHTGITFWAWKDLLKNQAQSKYKDWYWVKQFDDPVTTENEFDYHGWLGVHTLPEIKETQKQDLSQSLTSFEGNIYQETAKQHIFNVAQRWLDPDGDGDPSDGVDGFRLDVAAELPLGFWRDFRNHIRQVNPNAYLLGEIWWEKWPDKLLNPEPFLRGDVFDAVMNYRWYRAVRHFFNKSPHQISAHELIDSLTTFQSTIRPRNNYAMMNYTGGFDTPRILTSLFNKNKYKYHCKVHENSNYQIHKPDAATYQTLKMLLVQQYTYIGAPHIYAGDEMGMWGADDPSCRKPLIWPDYDFEEEQAHPLGGERTTDKVEFNKDLFQFHRQLIQLRKANPLLVHGKLAFMPIDDTNELFAYRRFDDQGEIIVAFNHLDTAKTVQIPRKFKQQYVDVLQTAKITFEGDKMLTEIPPRTAVVLKFGNDESM